MTSHRTGRDPVAGAWNVKRESIDEWISVMMLLELVPRKSDAKHWQQREFLWSCLSSSSVLSWTLQQWLMPPDMGGEYSGR